MSKDLDRDSALPEIGAPWATAAKPPFLYIVERFRFEAKIGANFLRAVSSQLAINRSRGMDRVLLSSNITGNPKEICQVWKTAADHPRAAAESANPEELAVHRRFYAMFFEEIASFERAILAPLPYDPHLETANGKTPKLEKNDTLLSVQARVMDGAMARLIALKQRTFKPTVERRGWELVLAGHVVSSSHPGSSIVQFWHLPETKSLPDTMASVAQNGDYRSLVAPLIGQECQELQSVISDAS